MHRGTAELMPYKDAELRKLKQREATMRWRAKYPEKAAQNDKLGNKRRRLKTFPSWYMRPHWHTASRQYERAGLFIGTQHEVSSPMFITWVHGKRRIETLREPFPSW